MSCGIAGARTCSASCAFGTCSAQTVGLRFAGSHVRLPASPIYDFGSSDFTVEFWVAADATQPGALPVLVSARVLIDVEWRGWWIGINHESSVGPLGVVYVGNDNGFVPGASGVDLRDGTWHHVAVVHHFGDFAIYVDGTLTTTLFYPEAFTAPGPIEVGGDPEFGPNYDFYGGIFDVRVWGTARSATEIREGMRAAGPSSTTGLRARYRFSEGSGQTVADSVRTAPGTLGSTTALESRDPAWVSVP